MLDHPEIAVKRSHANPARAVPGLKQAPVAQLDRAAASTGASYMKPQSLGGVQTPPKQAESGVVWGPCVGMFSDVVSLVPTEYHE